MKPTKCLFGRSCLESFPQGIKLRPEALERIPVCRCKQGSENLAHLVAKCPGIRDFTLAICKWTHKQLGIPFFRRDLLLGAFRYDNLEICTKVCIVRAVALRAIWISRNEGIFQKKCEMLQAEQVFEKC